MFLQAFHCCVMSCQVLSGHVMSSSCPACRHFDESSCYLLGKSWGGKQAALFAAANPDAVERLVLVCPALADPAVAAALPPLALSARLIVDQHAEKLCRESTRARNCDGALEPEEEITRVSRAVNFPEKGS